MQEKKAEYIKMSESEAELWWYRALHYRIFKEITLTFGEYKEISILDTGCGTGGLIQFLRDKGYCNITGFDISDLAIDLCRSKQIDVTKEDIFEYADKYPNLYYDVIVNSDVLCYIKWEKHKKIIADLHKMLNPGGVLLVNLPAFNIFKGEHDIAVGLLRRYSLKSVRSLFPGAKVFCWPLFLSPIILIKRLIQKLRMFMKMSKGDKSDVEVPVAFINKFLFLVCKFEIDRLRFFNWGSSMFIAIKKA
jgi:SAM-dependent methyltransferase